MKAHGPTTEKPDEDREVTIALDLRRWIHLLMCLDHYLGILHGSAEIPNQVQSDGEWPGRVQAIARELRSLVYAGEDQRPLSLGLSEAVTEFTPGVSPPSEPQRGKAWTAEENLAVVDAYFWMLENQIASREYRKIDKYRELMAGTLGARTRQSIEY